MVAAPASHVHRDTLDNVKKHSLTGSNRPVLARLAESAAATSDLDLVANYTPRKLDLDVWEAVAPFVRACVLDCVGRSPHGTAMMMSLIARLAAWAHVQGIPLERESVFSGRTVALFAERGCSGVAPRTRDGYRRTLMSLGSLLARPQRPRRPSKQDPITAATPYTRAEQVAFRSWARGARTPGRRESLAALLALGFGAGLVPSEISGVLVRHVTVDSDGVLVEVVGGKQPRVVPVLREWEDALVDAARSGRDPDEHLFLPRASARGHHVVAATNAYYAGSPSTPRMRSTWIVAQLAAGVPVRALMVVAGVGTIQAFERYLRFLPEPDMEAARPLLRRVEG